MKLNFPIFYISMIQKVNIKKNEQLDFLVK
jgi:hypothetical protein